MGLNIKNADVERLAAEMAQLTGETKTETIRRALTERRERLRRSRVRPKSERIRLFLNDSVWPGIPEDHTGVSPDRAEREEILGYGDNGV